MTADAPFPPVDELRRRRSAKWTTYGPDVLPMFVAEMDDPLAPAVAEAPLGAPALRHRVRGAHR